MVLERGNGTYVFDSEGGRYLDCVSGLAVNALGHGDYDICETIREHASNLIHVSNLYHTVPGALLAEQLVKLSFADRVFFCNSGTEAIEACIKFARRWAKTHGGSDKHELVTTEQSFHGRTMGSLSITGQPKYQEPFEPLVPGVRVGIFNDIDSTVSKITDNTAAVFLEPIQAEGGVNPASKEYLQAVREACDKHGALLVFDEIQVGLGRTGTLWAHEQYGVTPDMMSLAKPLGGGLPIGAVLLSQDVADAIQPGDHAATFGGGPLVTAVGLVVVEKVSDPRMLESVTQTGKVFSDRLREMQSRHSTILDVRGAGLIWGVEVSRPATDFVAALRQRSVLACIAGPSVLRFLPPLVVTEDQLHQVADHLDEILTEFEQESGSET
jgi:acetylornithine/N-succinyldiaminopimelate aminotransferase